ncbi:hypothetical protein F4805DRAFT_421700 [Annulohypoxylon moriforme]|nr:hypothetical protein F4805DRAFT_421700 [Annulohypoxylon moriforme]
MCCLYLASAVCAFIITYFADASAAYKNSINKGAWRPRCYGHFGESVVLTQPTVRSQTNQNVGWENEELYCTT